MKFYSLFQEKHGQYTRKERCVSIGKLVPLFLCSLVATIILSFFLYFPYPLNPLTRCGFQQMYAPIRLNDNGNECFRFSDYGIANCDLFKGHWVPDDKGSRYTDSSCLTIPESNNCFMQGRKDDDFLKWRWKPDDCDLPRFDAKVFLDMVRGNKMAFIGDSVARNQLESLLCLLAQEEVPKDIYKDPEDRLRIWNFRGHDFTLMTLWSRFLVVGDRKVINGSSEYYNLHLDKIDESWTTNLPTIDYAIIAVEHWFFRPIYLYEGPNIVGCVYCYNSSITNVGVIGAIQMTFRAAFKYVNDCSRCRGIVTVVRTFSPSHFENGSWNTGGSCNRTSPIGEKEIDLGGEGWELRKIQVEETERARTEGDKKGKSFVIMDVTKATLMRPDGHPEEFWGNKWMKGYNDCVHWCLPGPIEVWNEFLMAILEKETGLISS
ncbi:protein ALTERED XYLOGLUCAN 4-like [Pistacia vera]|uniref:protein ALTERED XYLOGLUCAN 4-like n=1 Tax=Pistacia vera TaxID=55513 RepID=UPI001262C654|nr:protein ALTERED XYLOGLUCAN 4-like [Pistacia vera]